MFRLRCSLFELQRSEVISDCLEGDGSPLLNGEDPASRHPLKLRQRDAYSKVGKLVIVGEIHHPSIKDSSQRGTVERSPLVQRQRKPIDVRFHPRGLRTSNPEDVSMASKFWAMANEVFGVLKVWENSMGLQEPNDHQSEAVATK